MILQNDSFSYPRYPDGYFMDSWTYLDSVDISKTKPKLSIDDDLPGITPFYDSFKVKSLLTDRP